MASKAERKRKQSAKRAKVRKPALNPVQGNMRVQTRTVEVDDPNYQPQHDGAKGNERTTRATINMRESPLVWYRHRNIVTDAQFWAGNEMRRLYELTGGGGAKAFDYTREPVDGGTGVSDGLTDARMDATKRLLAAETAIGSEAYNLIELVCAQCYFVTQLVEGDTARRRTMDSLRASLDDLAAEWGFSTKAQKAS